MAIRHVEPYTDEWLQQPISYVQQVVDLLGAEVTDWWEGPCDPRDATVRLTDDTALVWDEESGWRLGAFVSGDRGRHTELSGVRYLGHGLLPRPERVPRPFRTPGPVWAPARPGDPATAPTATAVTASTSPSTSTPSPEPPADCMGLRRSRAARGSAPGSSYGGA
ncbi:DUF6292 family protein [Nonomuraea rubra]|uniref:DUF6292 family protein n=1 Tax=Nonomuraea rubra TaxID=46180 RepID=UPI003605CC6D